MNTLSNSMIFKLWLLIKKYYHLSIYHKAGVCLKFLYDNSCIHKFLYCFRNKPHAIENSYFVKLFIHMFHNFGKALRKVMGKLSPVFKGSVIYRLFSQLLTSARHKPLLVFLLGLMMLFFGINIVLMLKNQLTIIYIASFTAVASALLGYIYFGHYIKHSLIYKLIVSLYPEN